MSTELVQGEVGLRPVTGSSLQEIMTLGRVFKASGYFKDVRDEAQAVTKILYGRELGFTPIVSIMGIYIIDGKPSLASNLLATLVKRSGKYDYRVQENTSQRCAILFRERVDGKWDDLGVTDFTMEEAKQAGVAGKDNWRKYPKAMLFARALSAGVRAHCPDVSVCPVYVPEELGADVNEEGEVKGATAQQPEPIKAPISFKRSAPNNGSAPSSGEGEAVPEAGAVPHTVCPDCNGTKREKYGDGYRECYRCNGQGAVTLSTAAGQGLADVLDSGGKEPAARSTGISLQEERRQEVAAVPAVEVPTATEYIDIGQQKNFHSTCRKAVREIRKLDADKLTYQWLLDNGYKNEQGEPTAALIPASGWLETRGKAVAWLKVQ